MIALPSSVCHCDSTVSITFGLFSGMKSSTCCDSTDAHLHCWISNWRKVGLEQEEATFLRRSALRMKRRLTSAYHNPRWSISSRANPHLSQTVTFLDSLKR